MLSAMAPGFGDQKNYPRNTAVQVKKGDNEMKYVVKISIAALIILLLLSGSALNAGEESGRLLSGMNSYLVEVVPALYEKALRNPFKGFTTRGIYDHEWVTLAHTYIRWNEIENHESDGIDKIRRVTDKMWGEYK